MGKSAGVLDEDPVTVQVYNPLIQNLCGQNLKGILKKNYIFER